MNNVCRTCLRTPENLLPLFDNTGLPKKIETICSVQVSETDNLPTKVCAECVININLSYNFRRIIINSDLELKRRMLSSLNENIIVNKEPEVIEVKIETESIDLNDEYKHDENEYRKSEVDTCLVNKIGSIEEKVNCDKQQQHRTIDNVQRKIRLRIQSQLMGLKRRKVYRCKLCDFTTTEYTKCYNHKRNHISTKSVCNICGKYIRTDNLKKHITTHTDPPVTCKECGKTFKNNESLRSHLLIHKGLEITCEFCGQTFKYRGGYQRHVRKQHTLGCNRKVKCPLCEKRFYDKTDLKKHIRSHTGERPYPCEYCKKGFSSSHALKTHIRQHTNEKPYVCEFCPMAFPQKVSLRTHLKSKHSTSKKESV